MRNRLIEFRGGRSQLEMAEKYNVSQQAWSKWERGSGMPRGFLMLQLERDSGIPIRDLFFDFSNNKRLLIGSGSDNPGDPPAA